MILLFVFILTEVPAQVTKMIQVKDQSFQMNGVQDGEAVEKKTRVFGLTINYETGELNGVVNLVELDLLNKEKETSPDPEQDALRIKGFLPINDILYNQNEQQNYKVELDLSIKEFTITALFEFNVAYIKNTQMKLHDVRANAPVNLNDFHISDLNGFEPEVNVFLMFQMLNLQR